MRCIVLPTAMCPISLCALSITARVTTKNIVLVDVKSKLWLSDVVPSEVEEYWQPETGAI